MRGLMALVFISNCWRMARLGSLASRMEWQLPHTTVSACPNERSVMAAPHFGQFSAFACGFGGPDSGGAPAPITSPRNRSEEHTSELQSQSNLVCRLLLEKKKNQAVITKLNDVYRCDSYR